MSNSSHVNDVTEIIVTFQNLFTLLNLQIESIVLMRSKYYKKHKAVSIPWLDLFINECEI